jgi:hypothetical protein
MASPWRDEGSLAGTARNSDPVNGPGSNAHRLEIESPAINSKCLVIARPAGRLFEPAGSALRLLSSPKTDRAGARRGWSISAAV